MRRIAVTLLVLAVLGGTAVAFAVTEALKLERRAITAPRVTETFAPNAPCGPRKARLSFRLTRRDRIDAVVVDAHGRPVRTLASGVARTPGRVKFRWDGSRDGGSRADDGQYRLRVHLARDDRTITLPYVVQLESADAAARSCLRGARELEPVRGPVRAELLARLGGLVGALGLALLVLVPARSLKLVGLALLAGGIALFVPLLAPSVAPARLAALAALAVPVVAALAALFVRHPWSLAFLALATAPARVPLSVDGDSARLLVPLYVVIAGAAVALAWRLVREPGEPGKELGRLSWPTALLVLWLGVSALWTIDVRQASIALFFFVLPFGLLAVSLARLPWSERGVVWLYRLSAAMALAFASIGIWQWVNAEVFWNPKIMASNVLAPFVRVNSVFWDPSMYGRFLVVAILASIVLLLFRVSPRWDLLVGAVVVALWVGLLFSFSQSSFVALIAAVALAAALAWRSRAAVAVALIAAILVPAAVAAPALEDVRETVASGTEAGLNRATSGRLKRVKNGLAIAASHPIVGVGVGGFGKAYAERVDLKRPKAGVSHTTPVTIAAETGIVGVALFLWFVAVAFVVALSRAGRDARLARTTQIVAALVLAAIFVHSLFYNAFFEDPVMWGALALAVLAARAASTEEA